MVLTPHPYVTPGPPTLKVVLDLDYHKLILPLNPIQVRLLHTVHSRTQLIQTRFMFHPAIRMDTVPPCLKFKSWASDWLPYISTHHYIPLTLRSRYHCCPTR